MKRLVVAMLFAGASQASYAGIYDLTFRRVAVMDEESACEGFIRETAEKFVAQTSARIIEYGCRADEFTVRALDAFITYQLSVPVKLTSTYSAETYSLAFYQDRAECVGQLEFQKELFSRATGLQALNAYCMLDLSNRGRWQTRVDGIGESALRPESSGLLLWGSPVDQASVLEKFKSAVEGYGINAYEVGFSHSGVGNNIVIRFYGSEPYGFEDYDTMTYEKVEGCAAAAAETQRILDAATKPVVVFCEKFSDSDVSILHAAFLKKILSPEKVFSATQLNQSFEVLSTCQETAARIENDFDDILGAVCAGVKDNYRIHLFSRP